MAKVFPGTIKLAPHPKEAPLFGGKVIVAGHIRAHSTRVPTLAIRNETLGMIEGCQVRLVRLGRWSDSHRDFAKFEYEPMMLSPCGNFRKAIPPEEVGVLRTDRAGLTKRTDSQRVRESAGCETTR